ncbi:MAG: D-alanyl-D-alanine carboxypeptidase family protein [Wujia sp.]
MKKKSGWIPIGLLFFMIFCIPMMCHAKEDEQKGVEVDAKSAVLMELETGTVLYEKNGEEMLRPASVTKVMTLLLIFEAIERGEMTLEDTVVISEHAASMGGSQCFFEAGEEQTVRDMIKCIEIASGNDAAVAMAEHICGSEDAFVERMNARAKELGMQHTNFVNACGLEAEDHLTCALDIAIMSRQLMLYHPEITEYSTIWMDHIFHITKRGKSQFDLANTNKFLNQYTGANGLKTGYTSQAGYCMSATASRNGITLVAVIMGAKTKEERNKSAMRLLDYGFAHCSTYEDTQVLGDLKDVEVKNGVAPSVRVKDVPSYSFPLIQCAPSEIKKEILPYKNLKAPIYEDDIVGVVQYSGPQGLLDECYIYAAQDIKKLDIKYSISYMISKIFMIR